MKNQLILLYMAVMVFIACKRSETDSGKISGKPNPVKENNDATAGLAAFEWDDYFCHKKGFYDPKHISEQQLKDAYYLWFGSSGIALSDKYMYTVKNFKTYDQSEALEKLEKDYQKEKAKLEQLQLPEDKIWQQKQASKFKELEEIYEIYSLEIKSYNNPEALLSSRFTGKCQEYAQTINGSIPQLMEGWGNLVNEMASKNGNPVMVYKEYMKQKASADSVIYAKTELIGFGWYNNANDQRDHSHDEDYLQDDFEKLFRQVQKIECAEPD